MRYSVCLCAVWLLGFCAAVCPAYAGDGDHPLPVAGTQWKGRKVAFMGDSITDKAHVGTTKNYWQYLQEMLGLVPFVYGINGQQWRDVPGQCERLRAERGDDIDAILIFAGTNDYNSGTPLGTWYTTGEVPVEVSGLRSELRTRRTLSMDGDTFRGRINIAMSYLKANFPDKQVILLTPIHRGYARFGDNNIQPDESYPNSLGLYADAYVDAVLRDIRMTYELLDWEKLDRLAAEIYHYEKVAAFGCDFSETAALDLQTKLRDQRKFIVTNIDDQKQADYIRNADDKTLVIVFSDSGEYVQNTDSVRAHWAFENFRGKIVMITSNPDAEKNPLVDYCLLYRHCREVHTHRILYAVLTDLLAYRYHEYLRSRKLLKENRI